MQGKTDCQPKQAIYYSSIRYHTCFFRYLSFGNDEKCRNSTAYELGIAAVNLFRLADNRT